MSLKETSKSSKEIHPGFFRYISYTTKQKTVKICLVRVNWKTNHGYFLTISIFIKSAHPGFFAMYPFLKNHGTFNQPQTS